MMLKKKAYIWVRDKVPIRSLAEAVVRHHGALFRKPFHVLRLLGQETLWDQEREVRVVDALFLDSLPTPDDTNR